MVAVRLRSSYMVAYFSYFMIALFILYLTEVEFISNYLAEGGSDQVCGIFSDFTEQGPTHVRIFLSVYFLTGKNESFLWLMSRAGRFRLRF